MPTPQRVTAGFTQDNPNQPLAFMGAPDPFFYHTFQTDFNTLLNPASMVISGNNSPTFTIIAADGGVSQLNSGTTTPAVNNFASFQLAQPSFVYTPGKRMFFLTRVATNDLTNNAIKFGLAQISATPFTTTIDGLHFVNITGTTNFQFRVVVGGVQTNVVTISGPPIGAGNNIYCDFGFEITPQGEIKLFAGQNLVGYQSQSGTAAQTTPPPASGLVARFKPTAFPSIGMSPLLGVQTKNTTAATFNTDFVLAAEER